MPERMWRSTLAACASSNSSGIGAIVFLFKRLSARERKLSIMNVQGQPLRLFVQLRLTFLLSADEASSAA